MNMMKRGDEPVKEQNDDRYDESMRESSWKAPSKHLITLGETDVPSRTDPKPSEP